MRYIFLFLVPVLAMAEDINTLYERIVQSNIYKSKSEALSATMQSKKSSLYSDGWNLGATVGYAKGRDAATDSATEFELSLSKEFNLHSSNIDTLIKDTTLYIENEKKIQENRLKVRLWQLYGNYCITMQALQAKGELASIYDTISAHIDKGVQYGEFDASKAIMAKLALENLNLQISKLENSVQNYEVQIKTLVPFDGQFECKHLKPDIYRLFNPEYSALQGALEKKIEISKEALTLANNTLTKINLGASYANEVDTDKYMLHISLPLAYGDKNQAARASAMHSLNASNYELETFRNNYIHESSAMENRLEIYRKYLKTSDKLIRDSSNTLIKQSNMRFRAGEESLISMLKATETKLQMIETILELKIDRHNAVAKYMYDYAIDPKGVSK